MSTDDSAAQDERAESVAATPTLNAAEGLILASLYKAHWQELLDYVDPQLEPAIRTRVSAEDIVQEVMLTASRRLPKYLQREQPIPAAAWLILIAYQEIINTYRKHKIAVRRSITLEVRQGRNYSAGHLQMQLDQIPADILTASWIAMVKEAGGRVQGTIAGLPDALQLLIKLRFFDKRPPEEVAEIMSMTVADVEKTWQCWQIVLKRRFRKAGILKIP